VTLAVDSAAHATHFIPCFIRISRYECTMVHDHHFDAADGGTEMRDVFRFSAPFGPLGWLAERFVLQRYMTRLLEDRNAAIKAAVEGGNWCKLLPING